MKKFINKNIFFFAIFIVVLIPVILISNYDNLDKGSSDNHNIISLQTKSKFDSLDVLFIGNSYCYSSVNTNVLDSHNISTFNLGIATAGVQFYDLVIDDYFAKIKQIPKKTFILVTPMTFSGKSDNYDSYPIHRYLENPKSNIEVALKYDRLDKLFLMYKKSVSKGFGNVLKSSKEEERFNNKGFFPDDKIVSDQVVLKDQHLYKSFGKETFEKSKLASLKDLASKIKGRGSEVVFFELPTNLLTNYFNESYLKDYDQAVVELAENYPMLRIESNLFSDKDYRNIDHMNTSGSIIATQQIVKYLQ